MPAYRIAYQPLPKPGEFKIPEAPWNCAEHELGECSDDLEASTQAIKWAEETHFSITALLRLSDETFLGMENWMEVPLINLEKLN